MSKIRIILFLIVAVVVLYFGRAYSIQLQQRATGERAATAEREKAAAQELAAKVAREDLVVGTGAESKPGSTVSINYLGTFPDGKVFDQSLKPFDIKLGAGQVIPGMEIGLQGMKVGGKRRITIPPEMGYGDQARGSIPANSTLIFEVELLEIK
ncbi:MAG: FKBP-type peptidyl-prolyl cis-trans isomerase [Candidatus Liptonbacteria bacterium]|nr:FKBP-type peptidyl-prolyl cis-trans isomerase [Candidatus Liptonbacteria bacterium]